MHPELPVHEKLVLNVTCVILKFHAKACFDRRRSMNHRTRFFASGALLIIATLIFSLSIFAAQEAGVPPELRPPVDEQLLLQLHAKGDQIYACKSESAQFNWNLKAPDAQLFDKKDQLFGKHFAGPSW